MEHGEIIRDQRKSRLNPALVRWAWSRYRWVYLGCLAVSLGLLTVPVLRDLPKLAWSGNLSLIAGLWAACLGGANAVFMWSVDNTAAFLLAGPVSRRQTFNTQVLGGLVPWLLLGALPALYAAAVSLGRALWSSHAFGFTAPVVFYVIYIIWTLAFYLFTVYQAASAMAAPRKAATNIRGVAWLSWLSWLPPQPASGPASLLWPS